MRHGLSVEIGSKVEKGARRRITGVLPTGGCRSPAVQACCDEQEIREFVGGGSPAMGSMTAGHAGGRDVAVLVRK